MALNENTVRLTKAIIDKTPIPPSGHVTVRDAVERGLNLRISAKGKMTWSVAYRTEDGRQRNPKIGTFPVLSVEAARRKAREIQVRVQNGDDPAAERQERKRALTMAELCPIFVAEHVQTKCKASTAAEYQRLIDKHIVPSLGRVPVEAVSTRDIADLHARMADTRTQANRTLALMSKMLEFAIRRGLRPDRSNPAKGQDRYRERQRERYLSSAEKRRLEAVLDELDQQQVMSEAVLAIRLLYLTGRRKSEILNLRWSDLDLDGGTMSLADSKVGAVTFSLTPTVVALLRGVKDERQHAKVAALDVRKRVNASPYVIPGRRYGQPMKNIHKPWERIRDLAGLKEVRLHDLRHTYASSCAMHGMDLLQIKRLMGHATIQTTQRYAHLNDDSVRRAVLDAEKALQL